MPQLAERVLWKVAIAEVERVAQESLKRHFMVALDVSNGEEVKRRWLTGQTVQRAQIHGRLQGRTS